VAERLGRGLQNLVQRFESARRLKKRLHLGPFFIAPHCCSMSSQASFSLDVVLHSAQFYAQCESRVDC
jgi:hypothetical protein